jgi:hypothetical protein
MPDHLRRAWFSREAFESLAIVGLLIAVVAFGCGAVGFALKMDRDYELQDRAQRWGQVEERYAVTVIDRTIRPPRTSHDKPVLAPMQVAGQARQCSVQVAGEDLMVFCGEDAVEAPRR